METDAVENVRRALRTDRTLPHQVFTSGWNHFEFFDSEWMRQAGFIGTLRSLLDVDGSADAAVVNLDHHDNGIEPREFRVDRTSPDALFLTAIGFNEDASNWLTCMVRLGASSNAGGWCAYCEPMAEIGVLSFRSSTLHDRARSVLLQIKALPINRAIAEQRDYVFQVGPVSNPKYFDRLVAEYGDNP